MNPDLMLREIRALLWKEFTVEWRKRSSLFGVLLYFMLVLFVVYLTVDDPEFIVWNGIFWIVLLFGSINALSRTFIQEGQMRNLYYHSLARPRSVLLAKLIYNTLLLWLLGSVCLVVYTSVLGFPVQHKGLYWAIVITGGLGFAWIFTIMSAIASRASHSLALTTILSLPVCVPLLLLLIRLSNRATADFTSSELLVDFAQIAALNAICLGLSLVLFPYLWRD